MNETRTISWKGKTRTYHIRSRRDGGWGWWLWFFPGANLERLYIALGRTIWIPTGHSSIPEDMFVHELHHLKQQDFSYRKAVVTFWRFWLSKKFRLDSELPAFQVQYQHMVGKIPMRALYDYRNSVAEVLSSKLYGEIITKAEAFERIGEKQEELAVQQ
jgi:hypothetical protein